MVFAKIFEQIFDSSIADSYERRHLFMDLLVLADRDGDVDMTADSISRRTNVPLSIVTKCLEELSAPDPDSRSHEENGRRIVLIDEKRNWGWHIVNYEIYRNIIDEESRRAYFRDRQRERRAREREEAQRSAKKRKDVKDSSKVSKTVSDSQTLSKDVTQAEAEAEAEAEASTSTPPNSTYTPKGEKAAPPPTVPPSAEEIYQAYPKHVGKPLALRAIRGAIRTTDAAVLLEKTKQYASAVIGIVEQRFIPHPSTFFNQHRFNDHPSTWVPKSEKGEKEKPETETDKLWRETRQRLKEKKGST